MRRSRSSAVSTNYVVIFVIVLVVNCFSFDARRRKMNLVIEQLKSRVSRATNARGLATFQTAKRTAVVAYFVGARCQSSTATTSTLDVMIVVMRMSTPRKKMKFYFNILKPCFLGKKNPTDLKTEQNYKVTLSLARFAVK